MADGTYERRGPREAELRRFKRLIAEAHSVGAATPVDAEALRVNGVKVSSSRDAVSHRVYEADVVSSRDAVSHRVYRVVLSLGSNVEPRRETIERALAQLGELPSTRLVKTSSVVETDPVGVPAEFADLKFLNCVAILETTLGPLDFSRRMHAIEDALGRVRTVRNGPRTIDIDLIDFGGLRLETPELTLPHPRWKERAFVTEPLAELGLSPASLALSILMSPVPCLAS